MIHGENKPDMSTLWYLHANNVVGQIEIDNKKITQISTYNIM